MDLRKKMIIEKPGLYQFTESFGSVACGVIINVMLIDGKLIAEGYEKSDLKRPLPIVPFDMSKVNGGGD